MEKTKMLKKNYEFRKILRNGKYFSGKYLEAYILKNKSESNLLGLAIQTKICKAFQRNKIKRLLRENYKILENQIIKGYSIVFLIKKKNFNMENMTFLNIKQDMIDIFFKAKFINKNEK